ncbi:MAG: HPF/RaiA family ribosome-associated protein [Gemmatimonadaceae bacterium]
MEIIFHAHHAVISERMRRRAELAVQRAAARLTRAVDAIVRFEQDGPVKRVEIVLHAPRQRSIVALAEDRFYGRALSSAISKLSAQARKLGRARKSAERRRAGIRARAARAARETQVVRA